MEFDYEEYLDDYFEPMELSEEEKEERKDIAKEIRDAILFWFWLLMLAFQYAVVDLDNLKTSLRSRLAQVVYNHSTADAYTVQYLDILTNSIFDTTMKDVDKQTQDAYLDSGYELDKTYALSDERATFIGANEADSISNREAWLRAIEEGYQYKTWKAFNDNRVRHDHLRMDNKKIPIKEYFKFPDCKMLYPHDEVHGSAKQIVNCRCVLSFSGKGENGQQDVEVVKPSDYAKIKSEPLLNLNLQFFAEEGIKKEKSSSLRKGIRSLRKEIELHDHKLAHPSEYWKDWDSFSDERKKYELEHWKHEQDNFRISIMNREEELRNRGELND